MCEEAAALRTAFENNQPFNSDEIKSKLEKKLTDFQDSIINESKQYLEKLNDWNDGIKEMNTDINEITGTLNRIKSDMGSKIITPTLEAGNLESAESQKEDPIEYNKVDVPQYPFDINLYVLDNVGHRPEDVASKAKSDQPLITAIAPTDPLPSFWNIPQDFFIPELTTMVNADDAAFETSFSSYYGFNSIPEVLKTQREIMTTMQK